MAYRLDSDEHLGMIRENFEVVLSLTPAQLKMDIAACPGWRIDSVADHLARCAIGWPVFMTTRPGQMSRQQIVAAILALVPEHANGPAAIQHCDSQLSNLLNTIDQLGPSSPCVFLSGAGTVADWLWHIAAETWIHRADVELALGREPGLTARAALEVLEWTVFYHLLVARGSADPLPPTVSFEDVETSESVNLGEGPSVASVSGTALDLSLQLWGRRHGQLSGGLNAISPWIDVHVNSPLG